MTIRTQTEIFPHSDHKLVKVEIGTTNFKRGPGYWKFNTALLDEPNFIDEMNNLIDVHF